MPTPLITIASYQLAHDLLDGPLAVNFKHVISINNPHTGAPRPLANHPGRHLVLEFHDYTRSSPFGGLDVVRLPSPEHVRRILEFAEGVRPDEHLLVHCAAGISRSSAAALAVIASRLEPSEESARRAVDELLDVKEAIRPNEDMVEYTDAALGYSGHLAAAWATTFGRGWTVPRRLADLEPDDFQ